MPTLNSRPLENVKDTVVLIVDGWMYLQSILRIGLDLT